jgi:hypothetical protein
MKALILSLTLAALFLQPAASAVKEKPKIVTSSKGNFVGRIHPSGRITDKRGFFVGRIK